MSTYYLTVKQTRVYALDNPVGDAWGYGKPQMPLAAVALAAGSFAAGVTAFAAATTMASMVAAGAVIAGSALSIIGTVTGNQKLAKIGGFIAIAGGITSIANTAMNAASTAGTAATDLATTAATDAATSTAADAAGGLLPEFGSEAAYGAAVNDSVPGLISSGVETATDAAINTGMLNASPAQVQDIAGQVPDAMSKVAEPPANVMDAGSTEVGKAGNVNAMDAGQTEVGKAANQIDAFNQNQSAAETARLGRQDGMLASANDPGMLAKFEAWSKANPQMAKMLMEGGKGMLGNLVTSPRDQAMVDYYRQNADTLKRKALWGSGRVA